MLSIFSCVYYPSVYLFSRNVYFGLLIFLIGLFVFLVLRYMSSFYILKINPFPFASFAIIFSHFKGFLFILFMFFFATQKLGLIRSLFFFNFCVYFYYSTRWVIEGLVVIYVRVFCFCFPLQVYSFLSYI